MEFKDYLEDRDGKLICIKSYHNKIKIGDEVGYEENGYRRFKFDGKRYLTHTVLHFMRTGKWIKRLDHEDGNSLNNKDGNLREATATQNSRNRKSMTGSSSQYLGVSKRRNKWIAQISVDNRTRYLGSFPSEEEAAKAYDEMATKIAGAFARLNFKGE